jgi:hypothetical protein
MPDWQYFKLEATVELPKGLTLDVAMGESISSKRRECNVVRFVTSTVQAGNLTRIGGDFRAEENAIDIDQTRPRHHLEIERNRGVGVVRVNRDLERQFVLTFGQVEQQPIEILFVASRNDPISDSSTISTAAISELVVSKLEPEQ